MTSSSGRCSWLTQWVISSPSFCFHPFSWAILTIWMKQMVTGLACSSGHLIFLISHPCLLLSLNLCPNSSPQFIRLTPKLICCSATFSFDCILLLSYGYCVLCTLPSKTIRIVLIFFSFYYPPPTFCFRFLTLFGKVAILRCLGCWLPRMAVKLPVRVAEGSSQDSCFRCFLQSCSDFPAGTLPVSCLEGSSILDASILGTDLGRELGISPLSIHYRLVLWGTPGGSWLPLPDDLFLQQQTASQLWGLGK